MRTIFHLVRHASTDHVGHVLTGRAPGVDLSQAGREQAKRLAEHMAATPVASLLSSPRKRARETAGLLAEATGLKPRIADALDEIDFGHWSGRTFAELDEDPDWRRWNEERDVARTPGGETMSDVAARILGQMDALQRSDPGGSHVLVSHADVIKAAVCHFLGLPFRHVLDFEVDPASVTVIATDGRSGVVLARNAYAGSALAALAA